LVFVYAFRDIFTTARQKDDNAQKAALSAELSDFRMATRTENNESLFSDPLQFSLASRPLKIAVLSKSFFTFLLHAGNARSITAAALEWDLPEACMTRFPPQPLTPKDAKYGFEGCLAAVRNDPAGRFVYFAFRFPSDPVVRHRQGQKPTSADFIRIDFQGAQTSSIHLVFETPALAEKRYPSQIGRFNGLHEVTGYSSDGSLIRAINAQAFERRQLVDGDERNFVTAVGRIDASKAGIPVTDTWPNADVSQVRAGIVIGHSYASGQPAIEVFSLPADASGVARISVEQAYDASVRSRSAVEVRKHGKPIWSSMSMAATNPRDSQGWVQQLSDLWAQRVVSMLNRDDPIPIRLEQEFGPNGQFSATIIGQPRRTDHIAARAYLWFTVGVVVISLLGVIWLNAILRVRRIAVVATKMAAHPLREHSLSNFAKDKDEIGALARIIDVLVRRDRSRERRSVRSNLLKLQEMDERVKLRQSILEAIGHEIRSPLQSLLSLNIDNDDVTRNLERMNRAVQALYLATSAQAGINDSRVVVETDDLAEYLSTYSRNKRDRGVSVNFHCASVGVFAEFDPIALDQVLEHLVDNAARLRTPGSDIEIALTIDDSFASIIVFNQGSWIEGEVESIFQFGFTTAASNSQSKGQGLFVARVLMLGMGGSITASNILGGVQMLLKLKYVHR